ncbi:lycopene cyclase domain-containing protein [Agreia pratensis]|uniref:lycopene cyclase domain-containing protein n=1 Tax=Agreia pratensis TaxID=150121 RepID=UPI00188B1F6D|nr:lycopene cyclase domain-containing protein [Agreia pratensis]MBF4634972.1 lycopene cyclase domain-containing protein [Agreia pratensis]
MNYWALNAIFLAVVALIAIVAAVRIRSVRPWVAVTITLGVLLVMTAVFDNVMIGVGLVGYEPSLISGAFVGIAPLEDFAYAVAAAILLPSLWMLLPAGSRASGVDTRPGA